MNKFIQFNPLLICSLCILILVTSCGNDDEPNPDGDGGLSPSLSVIMEPTEFFKATQLVVSEDGKYIVAGLDTRADGSNANYKYYFSKDAGQSFSELAGGNIFTFTAVSNNGMLLADHTLINLNDNSTQELPHFSYGAGPVLDANGVAYYTNETLYKFENGQSVDLGIAISALPGEMICTNGKIGFLSMYYHTLAVYDIATNILNTREWPVFDTNRLRGASSNNNNNAKLSFSDGYFGYASGGAAVVVNPNNQLTYYDYPSTYDYQDNPVAVMVEEGKLYMNLRENPLLTGNYDITTQTTFVASGSMLEEADIAFPRTSKVNGTVYYSGFIEGGKYRDYGLIKSTASGQEYLTTNLNFDNSYSNSGFVMEVGSKLFFRNKEYDLNSKTYQTSEFKNILYGFSEAQKTVVYTGESTFSTANNGNSWKLETENGITPNFVIKNKKGGYYGLTYNEYYYNPGGTGFQISKFDMAVYSSTDAINWQLIVENKDINGLAPKAISSDGQLIYTENRNPLGNPDFASFISLDEGATFEDFQDEVAGAITYTGAYRSYHEMPSGRYVAFLYQNPNLTTLNCTSFTDGCNQQQIMTTEIPDGLFKVSYTAGDEAIISGKTVLKITGL